MAARRLTVPAQIQPPRLEIRHLPTDSLVHYATNPRRNDPAVDRLVPLLREFGLRAPLLVHDIDGRTEVVDGHLRLKAATKLGLAEVPTVDVSDLSEAQIRSLRLAMNKSAEFAEWDDELLAQELRAIEALGMGLDLTGFGEDELAELLGLKEDPGPSNAGALAAAFGVPPFTVLNAREGWWQDRKRAWLALGIASELGRGAPPGGGGGIYGDGGAPTPSVVDRYNKTSGPRQKIDTNPVAAGQGGMVQALAKRIGRKRANATPGGGMMPATDYSKSRARGDGRGRKVKP